MKKDDLIEFLSSTIEEDAIISRIYNLFHNEWNYSLDELNEIINFGVKNGDLVIENVKDPAIQYDTIDWQLDNVYQEILMVDIYKYMPLLFNENPQVPNEYEKIYKRVGIMNSYIGVGFISKWTTKNIFISLD